MRKILFFVVGVCFLIPSLGAEEAVINLEAGKQAIRDRVRSLREERFEQRPYLDPGFIREQIRSEDVREKETFMAAGEKSLGELIERAMSIHTRMNEAHERISLGRRKILVALRNLFPTMKYAFEDSDGKLSDRKFNSRNYEFSFTQPLFRGGILWNTLLREKEDWDAAKRDYEAVVQNLIKDVSVAYFEFQRAQQVERDEADTLVRMEHYMDISEKKFAEGIISEIEDLNVKSLYGQIRYDNETAKQELELARLELQKLLELENEDEIHVRPAYSMEALLRKESAHEDSPFEISGQEISYLPEQVTMPALQELVDLAYQNRPELQVKAHDLKSARFEERIQFGGLLPHADVMLEFGKLGEAYDDLDLDPGLRKNFHLMLQLKWNAAGNTVGYTFDNKEIAPSLSAFQQSDPGNQITSNKVEFAFLDGLQDFVDTKDAEVSRLKQVIELEEKEKEIVRDVKKAYFDYQKSRIQVQSSIQRVDYRRRRAEILKHKLEQNEIEISEYMDAEIALLRERATLHKALSDYFSAKAQMNHAVGIRDYFPIKELKEIYE